MFNIILFYNGKLFEISQKNQVLKRILWQKVIIFKNGKNKSLVETKEDGNNVKSCKMVT